MMSAQISLANNLDFFFSIVLCVGGVDSSVIHIVLLLYDIWLVCACGFALFAVN